MPRCSALFNHECIDIRGNRKPCCRFEDAANNYNVSSTTINEYLSSSYISQIRKVMEDDWHPGCRKCKDEEMSNRTSLRQLYNLDHTFSNKIESIELSISNKCNLTCKMCSSTYSSKWQELNSSHNINDRNITEFSVNDIFTEERDLSSLRMIKYLGGEPFITPELETVFKILDSKDILQNITFMCSTNATLFPKKYIKYLNKMKLLRINLSIDAIGELNSYIRPGKSWQHILNVISEWKEYRDNNSNIELGIFSTIQAYNIHDIKTLIGFSNTHNLQFRAALLNWPVELSINALPKNYISQVSDTYNLNYLKNYKYNSKYNAILIEKTKELDNLFKHNINNFIPLLAVELGLQ